MAEAGLLGRRGLLKMDVEHAEWATLGAAVLAGFDHVVVEARGPQEQVGCGVWGVRVKTGARTAGPAGRFRIYVIDCPNPTSRRGLAPPAPPPFSHACGAESWREGGGGGGREGGVRGGEGGRK